MEVLQKVLGIFATVTGAVSGFFSTIVDISGPFGTLIFIAGFVGLLFTFLWFFFRFLDKKRLALPTILFALFFVLFLSGNLLLIAQDARTGGADGSAAAEQQTVQTLVPAEGEAALRGA